MKKTPEQIIRISRFAVILLGLVLAGNILYLVASQYRSQLAIHDATISQHIQEAEQQAISLSYFFNERKNDLHSITNSRSLSAYFEDKALGMSMEYGLAASIQIAGDFFDAMRQDNKLGKQQIFERLVFIEKTGKILIDSHSPELKNAWTGQWQRFLAPLQRDTMILSDRSGPQPRVIISSSFYFKNTYAGQLLAWIPFPEVFDYFTAGDRDGITAVSFDNEYFLIPAKAQQLLSAGERRIPEVAGQRKPFRYNTALAHTSEEARYAVFIPMGQTPLALIKFLPPTDIQLPKRLLYTSIGLAAFILAGIFVFLRLSTHNAILRTRLEETILREQAVDEKNLLLETEIEERLRAEQKIQRLAYFDPLTALPNRVLLHDRLSQSIAQAERSASGLAVLFFDLDHFKLVNDTMGHVIGDNLLQGVAARLSTRLRKTDTVARMGGDEFVMVIPLIDSADSAEAAAKVTQHLIAGLYPPLELDGKEIFVTASIGIAIYPYDGKDSQTLLKNADTAMYHAKERGRNNYQFYTEEMNVRTEERLAMETSLRHALDRQEFHLVFQPWIDLNSCRITGLEALLRWNHPVWGEVVPAHFIPVAEEIGMIIPIGAWVLKTACEQVKALHDAGFPDVRVAVNLSGRQMKDDRLEEMVRQVLDQTGINPKSVELELTESIIMGNAADSLKTMNAIRHMGVGLAIDDFGTGYSSLNYLKRFPIGKLKIDRSFINDIPDSPDDVTIVRAIIALANSLKLKVVGEGVENKEQFFFLLHHNCDEIQGYYLSHPQKIDKITELLQKDFRHLCIEETVK